MRMRERGIDNMPFIAMIVLLVVAIGLFFMKSDDASTWQAEAARLKAQNAANIETLDGARKAYGALLDIGGLGISELQPKEEGGKSVYPPPSLVKDKTRSGCSTRPPRSPRRARRRSRTASTRWTGGTTRSGCRRRGT